MSTREMLMTEIAVIPDSRLNDLYNIIKRFVDNVYRNSEDSDYFDEQIKAELLEKGYSGNKFLSEFYRKRAEIKPAVENLTAKIDKDLKNGVKYATYDEVFGE
jgi:3-hydroxyacyl-CoA dehydrogenase